MKRIYVAGPYTAEDARKTQLNVYKAIEIGCELLKRGYAPFIPHLCHYILIHPCGEFTYEEWTSYDIEWLKMCEAFYLIDESPGASEELKIAKEIGLEIYYELDDVPKLR